MHKCSLKYLEYCTKTYMNHIPQNMVFCSIIIKTGSNNNIIESQFKQFCLRPDVAFEKSVVSVEFLTVLDNCSTKQKLKEIQVTSKNSENLKTMKSFKFL